MPRLSPTTNIILDYVRAHPAGVRAADLVAVLAGDGEDIDPESPRHGQLASTAKTHLRRLCDAGRVRRISLGLYGPTVLPEAADPAPGGDASGDWMECSSAG